MKQNDFLTLEHAVNTAIVHHSESIRNMEKKLDTMDLAEDFISCWKNDIKILEELKPKIKDLARIVEGVERLEFNNMVEVVNEVERLRRLEREYSSFKNSLIYIKSILDLEEQEIE